jgi:hypothetical protein
VVGALHAKTGSADTVAPAAARRSFGPWPRARGFDGYGWAWGTTSPPGFCGQHCSSPRAWDTRRRQRSRRNGPVRQRRRSLGIRRGGPVPRAGAGTGLVAGAAHRRSRRPLGGRGSCGAGTARRLVGLPALLVAGLLRLGIVAAVLSKLIRIGYLNRRRPRRGRRATSGPARVHLSLQWRARRRGGPPRRRHRRQATRPAAVAIGTTAPAYPLRSAASRRGRRAAGRGGRRHRSGVGHRTEGVLVIGALPRGLPQPTLGTLRWGRSALLRRPFDHRHEPDLYGAAEACW